MGKTMIFKPSQVQTKANLIFKMWRYISQTDQSWNCTKIANAISLMYTQTPVWCTLNPHLEGIHFSLCSMITVIAWLTLLVYMLTKLTCCWTTVSSSVSKSSSAPCATPGVRVMWHIWLRSSLHCLIRYDRGKLLVGKAIEVEISLFFHFSKK